MTAKKAGFTRKKALAAVIFAAVVLAGLLLLRWGGGKDGEDLSSAEGREAFLNSLGWEIDAESEEYKAVHLPEKLDGLMTKYNALQLERGLDLNAHLGEECEQYSYILTNYPDCGMTVYATLYVQRGELIAGDIHTSSIGGFMTGLKAKEE